LATSHLNLFWRLLFGKFKPLNFKTTYSANYSWHIIDIRAL